MLVDVLTGALLVLGTVGLLAGVGVAVWHANW
jgi:hypothetical protein